MNCPKCGTGQVMDGERFLVCDRNVRRDESSCNFIIWRNVLQKLGHEKLTDSELKKLLAGKEIPLKLTSNKSGTPKPFECSGFLAEVDGRWKIEFKFAEKKEVAPKGPVKVFGVEVKSAADLPVANPMSPPAPGGDAENWEEDTFEEDNPF